MKLFLRFFILILFLFSGAKAFSQTFTITEIDTSGFPYLRAGFIALDAAGNSFKNLSPGDFRVNENGQSMNPSLWIECKDTMIDPCISVILVLDKSGSMDSVLNQQTKDKRWAWVKQGVTSFLNLLKFNDCTNAAMVTFAFDVQRKVAWADSAKPLLDSLKDIKCAGGTDYNPAFLDWTQGAIRYFEGQPSGNRRIIIFLTDGNPLRPVATDSIIKALNDYNVQVYAITVGMPMNDDLAIIAKSSGGLAYSVKTKEELDDIYRTIAIDIQKKIFCYLNWVAPYGCSEASLKRQVDITFLKIPEPGNFYSKTYVAPDRSISRLVPSETYPIFGDNTSKNITLTAMRTKYHVESVTIAPPGMSTYFKIKPGDEGPFDIDSGQSRDVNITYDPGTLKQYRQAQLVVNGTPCPLNVSLVAGLTNIKIIHPNGGEVFSTCDTIDIVWGGVDKNTPVSLFYSTDGGSTWILIKNDAKGLSYKWYPVPTGIRLKVKGIVSTTSSFMWAKSAGGTGADGATSVAVDNSNINIYSCGYFENTAQFGTNSVSSKGGSDIFLAKYANDGGIAGVISAGGPGNDTAHAVCVGPDGTIYVAGVCYQGIDFGTISPDLPVAGVPYLFVAGFPPAFSSATSVRIIGATEITKRFEIRGLKIRYSTSDSKIYVQGEYKGFYLKTAEYEIPASGSNGTTVKKITVTLNADLSQPSIAVPGVNYTDYSSNKDSDGDGNIYEVGAFSGTVKKDPFTITSAGATDAFITKYGSTPGSADTSDNDFKVEAPKLTFKQASVNVGSSILGHQTITTLTGILCNTGTLPIKIIDKHFNGTNPGDFSFDAEPPSEIGPGECIDLSISFIPQDMGFRSSQLIITGSCADPVALTLNGTGVCTAEVLPDYGFGNQPLMVAKHEKISCALKNINWVDGTTLTISPKIEQGNLVSPNDYLNGEFTIDSVVPNTPVPPDGCVDVYVAFKPQMIGTRKAYLNYQLPGECEKPLTLLVGEGIDTNLFVEEVDFGPRRVLSRNDSFFVVTNKTVVTQKITDVHLENNDNIFKLGTPAKFDIPAGDTLHIPVTFTPAEELPYKNTVIVTVENFPSKLRGDVLGIGAIPKFEASWICGTPVKPGAQNTGILRVINPGHDLPLKICKMDFRAKTEFTWKNDLPFPSNVIIDKGDTMDFEVYFKPSAPGIRADLLDITADNVAGKEPVACKDTTIDILCEALGVSADSTFDMGNVLVCSQFSKGMKITNNGWQTPVTITGYRFNNADSVAFSISLPANFVIEPGNTAEIPVTFKPLELKDYAAKLTLFSSENIDVNITLKGSGKVLNLYTDNKEYKFTPGTFFWVPVKMAMPLLSDTVIKEMTIQIKFDNKICYYQDGANTFNSTLTGWNWNRPVQVGYGLVEVSGTGSLRTPFDGELFNIAFTSSLSDKKEAPMLFHPVHKPCVTPDTAATMIKLSDVCFLTGRLVTFGSTQYSLKAPQPNPVSGSTKINFAVGLNAHTSIYVYNSLGEIVSTLVDTDLKSGIYELDLSVDNLSSGVYMIKMVSGPFTGQQSLVISR